MATTINFLRQFNSLRVWVERTIEPDSLSVHPKHPHRQLLDQNLSGS